MMTGQTTQWQYLLLLMPSMMPPKTVKNNIKQRTTEKNHTMKKMTEVRSCWVEHIVVSCQQRWKTTEKEERAARQEY